MSVNLDEIVDEFEHAVEFVKETKTKYASKDKYRLYGLFQQAVIGDNTTDKPGILSKSDRSKWTAWTDASGLSAEEAMVAYVRLVKQIDTTYTKRRSLDEQSLALVSEFQELPNEAPERYRFNALEGERRLSTASGKNPLNNTMDDDRRLQLYERLSKYYRKVDRLRLNQGIGDIVEYGLFKGVEELGKKLLAKYGVGLDEFETEENENLEREKVRRETAARASMRKIQDTSVPMDALEKDLTQFFLYVDPDRLDRGFNELIAFSKRRGLHALNRKLFRKYGMSLQDDVTDERVRKATHSTETTSVSRKHDEGEPNISSLHKIDLPEWVKSMLESFYTKYEPSKVKQGDTKAIYQWAQRNGLKLLDNRLKDKYNQSLSEFKQARDAMRDELIGFYTKADKTKLVSGLESILSWGVKNGRRALNEKLREKYGYDLDNQNGELDWVDF